ncbi:MAG: Lsr2 family protein [Friedmanniella sp.]|jgi:hypothetical protein
MAQKTVVKVYDDIDGTELDGDGQTVSFSLDGASYEIDLGPENARKLQDALSVYVASARRVGGMRKGRGAASPAPSSSIDNKAVRAWAEANGLQVSSRGRISQEIIDKYRAAGH